MKISFFEEYPSKENLRRLQLVKVPTSLYLGSKSVKEFLELRQALQRDYKQVKQVIYWPILDSKEGYWLSAFSKTEAIKRISRELKITKEPFPVLWDAELPTLNKKLFFTELPNLIQNKKLIHEILLSQLPNHPLVVAQFPKLGLPERLSQLGASSFPFSNYHRLDMLYSSIMNIPNSDKYILDTIRSNKNKYQHYSVSFGLLAGGQEDESSLISLKDLDRELTIAKEEHIEEVVMYRLGGLNMDYLKVLEKYCP